MGYIIVTLFIFLALVCAQTIKNNNFLAKIKKSNLQETANLSFKAAERSKRLQVEFYLHFKEQLFQFLLASRQKPEKNALIKFSQDFEFYFDGLKDDFLSRTDLSLDQLCFDEFFEPEETEQLMNQIKTIYEANKDDIMNEEGFAHLLQFVRKTNARAKHSRLSLLGLNLEDFKKETQRTIKKESLVSA
jgi:hypothetical protein